MNKEITLAVVDDHQLFRKGIALLLQHYKELKVVIEAENGIDLIKKMEKIVPDVILMDLKMPLMGGAEATEIIKAKYPEIKIIALTMYNDESVIVQLIEKGINGFLLKEEEIEILVSAVHSVMETGIYFNDTISRAILEGLIKDNKIHPKFKKTLLSEKEIEIISLICGQFTNKEIAGFLNMSPRTIDGMRERILTKTGARNTAGIVLYAIKNNLINP